MPWAPVSCTPQFPSQKTQEGKLCQRTSKAFLFFWWEDDIWLENCSWTYQFDCLSVAFLLVNLSQFLGKKITLLSTNKQLFPKLFTENDKPNGKCYWYVKEGVKHLLLLLDKDNIRTRWYWSSHVYWTVLLKEDTNPSLVEVNSRITSMWWQFRSGLFIWLLSEGAET